MFYSKKYNLLFIASPKSGSTSVENFLFRIDESGENHSISLNGRVISGKDMHFGVVGHARAWELRNAMGNEEFNKLDVFGFVRHPLDKLVSTYFFNKKLNPLEAFTFKGRKKRWRRKLMGFSIMILARILPFKFWAFIFPMKSSYEYFYDNEGKRIVKYIGRTDYLNHDLLVILRTIGIDVNFDVPHINRSNHKDWEQYFESKMFRAYIEEKYKRDISLYNDAEKEIGELERNNIPS